MIENFTWNQLKYSLKCFFRHLKDRDNIHLIHLLLICPVIKIQLVEMLPDGPMIAVNSPELNLPLIDFNKVLYPKM
jgi:hypothetical protein